MSGPVDWDAAVLGPVMSVFAEPITYTPAAGAPFSAAGVVDEAYHAIAGLGEDGVALTTEIPVVGVQLSTFLQAPVQGDQLTVARTGITYAVKEVRSDGHGWAKLMLTYVSG